MIGVYGCHTVYKYGQEIVELSLRGSIALEVSRWNYRVGGIALGGHRVRKGCPRRVRLWAESGSVWTSVAFNRHNLVRSYNGRFDYFSHRFVTVPVSNHQSKIVLGLLHK